MNVCTDSKNSTITVIPSVNRASGNRMLSGSTAFVELLVGKCHRCVCHCGRKHLWHFCSKCFWHYSKVGLLRVQNQAYVYFLTYSWQPLDSQCFFFVFCFFSAVCAEFKSQVNLQLRQTWPRTGLPWFTVLKEAVFDGFSSSEAKFKST